MSTEMRYPFWVNRVAGLLQIADGLLCFVGIHRWGLTLAFYSWYLSRADSQPEASGQAGTVTRPEGSEEPTT